MKTKNLVFTALCMALAIILPQAFHMIPNAGSIFLPMHIPVLLCGLTCGPLMGLVCGFFSPVLSHLITGMPPAAFLTSMILELTVYGLISGLLNRFVKTKNNLLNIYISLLGAMICGRLSYGIVNALILRAGQYSMQIWLSTAIFTALPGIIIQLILIPFLVVTLKKGKLI